MWRIWNVNENICSFANSNPSLTNLKKKKLLIYFFFMPQKKTMKNYENDEDDET